uniref:NADH-ubiquinone oxidoreductase chain 4L n=2 Tax=Ochthebius TaxID=174908 RepID=A0A7H0DKI0_9COLE|nr:NADH dehydrogenase subunit 4L [Ochthebius magnannulatus]YP_009995437.1 NADH dehydrogenase subunit 4L [Ochthebius mediterraneus]QNP09840.1 NADH dehydrogenase subunit 4L [Ochthebius magnannulatus]QNP09866.1 NADH dehydrogenase subunit 4L [Ochthebius mediterraneus]
MLMLFSIFMYFCGLFTFCLKRKHLLLMLLSLEFIILSLYFMMFIYLSYFNNEFYFSMIFISMSVCEGALGLSLLVSLIRSHGNDYFQSFNILW